MSTGHPSAQSAREKAKRRLEHVEERARSRTRRTTSHGSRRDAPLLEQIASYWWVELLLGVFWIVIAAVLLKFNHASVTTVGILIGLMLLLFAAQEFVLAAIDRRARWLWAIFGVLLTASGIIALTEPSRTFAGFADILGFVFLLIGVLWMVQAFAERPINDLWWLTLISGMLMIGLGFWVSGQFLVTRAYTLLVFAGIWALTTGIIDIVRAFEIREVYRTLRRGPRL